MTPVNDDIAAIEAALAAGPTPEWRDIPLKAHACERLGISVCFVNGHRENEAEANALLLATIDPARLRRVLDTMAQMASALETLLPMGEEWHEEFPRDVGDAEAPAIEAARAALAAYRGNQ